MRYIRRVNPPPRDRAPVEFAEGHLYAHGDRYFVALKNGAGDWRVWVSDSAAKSYREELISAAINRNDAIKQLEEELSGPDA